MIKTYGLHWAINKVDWGTQGAGNTGTLLGAKTRSKNARTVDFREQRGIYALYADYDLIYVGQAGGGNARLFRRLKEHRNDHLSERWNRFSWFGTQRVTKQNILSVDIQAVNVPFTNALNIMEAVSIAISEPTLNFQRGKWSEAKQYFQPRDQD